jgi:DNA segregation ATPase FtsK/SpoIIIE, S-DNA-T family
LVIGTPEHELKRLFRFCAESLTSSGNVVRHRSGSVVFLPMDIVVRTLHGDADVSIASHAPTTTLGDVIAAVTGQAVPRLVVVDGRAVDASIPLDDVDLLVGSVVSSAAPTPPGVSDADVELVQVAGHGAGRMIRLAPGRYRIGPGRRSSANELDAAPVERCTFELVVEASGTMSEVSVVPEGSDVAIDGEHLDGARPWHTGTLTVGSRAFQLDNPAPSDALWPHRRPVHDGSLPFSRPPRRMSASPRRPVVDAVRAATDAAPTLWERRPDHPDAFVLPIGVRTDGTFDIDLGSQRAVAIAGSERFRDALARSLLIEAVTLHGPADLDLVVLTDRDRLAHWDWAKWLAHLRVDGKPAIWSSRHDIARWAEEVDGTTAPETVSTRSSHLTVVIIDDPGLWNRPDSPIRSIVSNPPDGLRLIALCNDDILAPAVCTTVISETGDDLARVRSFVRAGDELLVRAALTEADVAVRVARALAPLTDVELPPPSAPTTSDDDRVELHELVGATAIDEILTRWATDDDRTTTAIGRRGDERVDVPIADDVTVVLGSSMGDAFDVAATALLGQCVDRPPDALWIAPMVLEHSPRAELLWRLPHATDRHEFDATIDPRRLLARLRAVLDGGPTRVVLVAEVAGASTTWPDGTWLTALAEGVRTIAGLAMVVVTDRPDVANLLGDTVIRVERRYDVPGIERRVAIVAAPDGSIAQQFTPLQPTTSAVASLVMRPFVVGRALTPLERRIAQDAAQTANAPHPALDTVVAVLRDAASQAGSDDTPGGRTVVPPPIPTRVALEELFDAAPGDGVPLGLVDDPGSASLRIRWWEPGSGSMLVFGSRRSGMEQVLATILLGVIDRFSPLDVRLVAIEPSAARRRALGNVDRSMRVAAPDRSDEVSAALDEIVAELERCTSTSTSTSTSAGTGGPRMVVLIGDLVDLRRRYAGQPVGDRIDEVLARAAVADSGVDVVAAASELEGAGSFTATAASVLVGASSDLGELAALGIDRPNDLDGIVGRCRSFPGGDLVQVAMGSTTIEDLLARRSIGGST